ncbi:stage V sporulation protein AA [Oceanobacillus sp. CAU 1775]
MKEIVYLRLKRNVTFDKYKKIQLKDISYIIAPEEYKKVIENKVIYQITKKDQNVIIIDVFLIIKSIQDELPGLEIDSIGPAQSVIRVKTNRNFKKIPLAFVVWMILFIGTSMTIMNFHYDVSMQEVQQKLHVILTGETNEHPLWIQVPYSLGLGVGTILFFNHWFKRRFNEEPSPLEVEIFNYQQNLDEYLIIQENTLEDTDDTK